MPKVITIVSQYSNTGKTTTLINFSSWLGLLGKKVLIIDLDSQSVATDFLLNTNKKVETIEDVILEQIPLDSVILDTSVKGLSLIPSTHDAANVGLETLFDTDIFSLKDSIDLLEEDFDYIFLDIAGGIISNTYKSCLVASDQVFISLKGEAEEIENIHNLINSIAQIKSEYNNWLELSGMILTLYNNQSSFSSQMLTKIRENFGDLLYKSTISRNNLILESCNQKVPVVMYDIKSFGAESYLRLAKEFIQNNI